MPRWGLVDRIAPAKAAQSSQAWRGPSAERVRATLFTAMVVFAIAALVHVVRYVLMIINRNTLLNPWVAGAAVWLGVLASAAAMLAAIGCAVVLTRWLVARRDNAFDHLGEPEPRPVWALWAGTLLPSLVAVGAAAAFAVSVLVVDGRPSWARMAIALVGCLLPLAASVWALVYVIELARAEGQYRRLREAIWRWWLSWLVGVVTSVFATATSFAREAQGIGNNAVAVIVAYLLAVVVVMVSGRLFDAFEQKPIQRPAHRWVPVAEDHSGEPAPAPAVESAGAEPAA